MAVSEIAKTQNVFLFYSKMEKILMHMGNKKNKNKVG